MNTTLTTDQLTELRDRAQREAGSFIDPVIFREYQDAGGHPRAWAVAVVGEQPSPRGWSWPQIYLLHLARQVEPVPPAEPASAPWAGPTEPEKPTPAPAATGPNDETWEPSYHVPRSQVWEGSGGGQAGHVHLAHAEERAVELAAATGRPGRITRQPGFPLCGKPPGWYERPPGGGETRCPRCVALAERYGIQWP